ncbi:MAG TPA: hypothetical protein VFS05_14725 [Gemmatimonadaceae bacterium]|nr:hypothetical protein [Gemmatimonadaceae bacterium]
MEHRATATALRRIVLLVVLATPLSAWSLASASQPSIGGRTRAPVFRAVAIAADVRDSMNAIFASGNRHWNELQDVNTLAQMMGTVVQTQKEYLGCLRGRVERDTLWVTATEPARDMKRFQFAVTGDCAGVPDLVGTWHTHPYRADLDNHALKERVLSRDDLVTFTSSRDLLILAVWDADSLDAAARDATGDVRHPVEVVVGQERY